MLLSRCLLLAMHLLFVPTYAQLATVQPPKLALLIHLNRYKHWVSLDTKNGLPLIKNALARQQFQILPPLINEDATARAVRAAFHRLINDPKTGVRGKKGAMVVVALDGHGAQVPDVNNDEKKTSQNPLDLHDEAFVAFDSPKSDQDVLPLAANTRHPDGYLLDDELGLYYDSIRHEIGPEGHLMVLMPGCHTASGNRGNNDNIPELLEPLFSTADVVTQFIPVQQGKFVYFASVQSDANTVQPNSQRYASPLLYGVSMALNHLAQRSTYLDLFNLTQQIVNREKTQTERTMSGSNPKLSADSDRHELVFGGYVTPGHSLDVVATRPSQQPSLWDSLKEIYKGLIGNRSGNNDVPDATLLVIGGLSAGQQPGRVVELTDAAGNSVSLATVLAANDTAALIRPDRPLVNAATLQVRHSSLTLWLYTDPGIDSVLRDSLSHWVGLTNIPTEASLRLSYINGTYRLCTSRLPYSANGCGASLLPDAVLPKIRSLALYQILRQYERRNAPVTVTYRQAEWVRGWAFAPADSARRDRWRRLQFREGERLGERRYDSLTTIKDTYQRDGNLIVDTRQSSLLVDIRMQTNVHYTYLDILPDQPVDGNTLKPNAAVGRLLTVQNGNQIIWFEPPFGLEENAFVFSANPLNIQGVLAGKVPLHESFIRQIGYVVFDFHYILPDRQLYRH